MPLPRAEYAELDWIDDENGHAMPRSSRFDDIYFANQPIAETTHVFLDGNHLCERFASNQNFSIGETGFGSGLNFLCAWALWEQQQKHAPKHPQAQLHFLSFEKYPLRLKDVIKIHQMVPELSPYTTQLQKAWPINICGFHRLNFPNNVSLTLYIGDILDGFQALAKPLKPIDAWFLDGFSPAKNPQLWNQEIYSKIAHLSARGTTISTFTVAGHVRRGLTQAGFDVEKADGFGNKRNMLRGVIKSTIKQDNIIPPSHDNLKPSYNTKPSKQPNHQDAPWFSQNTIAPLPPSANIAIIGGGIAGASLAYALRQQGFSPTIFETRKLANGASGNKAGLITPRLDRDNKPEARFHLHAWLYTHRLLEKLQRDNPTIALFYKCSAQRLKNHNQSAEQLQKVLDLNILPPDWLLKIQDGIFIPQSGVVSPPDFVKLLVADTKIIQDHITTIDHQESCIILNSQDQKSYGVDAVILANGFGALKFLTARGLPLDASLGQIDIYETASPPTHAISCGPYAAPLPDNTGTGMVIGATYKTIDHAKKRQGQNPYHPANHPIAPNLDAARENLDRLGQYYPHLVKALSPEIASSRAAIRCMTPDFSPIVGPMPDWAFYAGAYDGLRQGRLDHYLPARYQQNTYILSGLGSRGLVTAPLAATMIAAQIAGSPAPVEKDIYHALHAGRFFIRSLRKAKTINT